MTPTPTEPPPCCRLDWFLPWRWAWLGWLVAAVFLIAGVPLFLRMPLWADANLYDTAAYNLLAGGVHYRDVFDTNLPGFVGVLTAVRWLFGPSSEAVRAVDLGFIAAITILMLRFAAITGASVASRAWAIAAIASFYPFISEFNHLQRDVWMMLPVLGASYYRFHRLKRMRAIGETNGYAFRSAVLEGIVWGLAVWVKPHVIVMAAAAWLALTPRLIGTTDRWRLRLLRLLADFAGVTLGGALAGGAGLAWLYLSGTWPHFLDVFQNWNTQYLSNVISQFYIRYPMEFTYFPPWSIATAVGVVLAVLNLIDGRVWSLRWEQKTVCSQYFLCRMWRWVFAGPKDETSRLARALFAAVYLAWVAMALVLQREFHYAHVPEVLLMIGLFAMNGWAFNFALLTWQLLTSAFVLMAVDMPENPQWRRDLNKWHVRHAETCWFYANTVSLNPAYNPDRLAWWPTSLKAEVPRELRNGVAFQWDFHAGVNWVELGAVEDFLRSQDVKDGELLCWHDSPHALYRKLGIKPGFRFMHVTTASEMGEEQYQKVKAARDEVAPHLRFVVADLYRVSDNHTDLLDLGPDGIPRTERIPPMQRKMFPLNQPIVFRSPSGRYLVMSVSKYPLDECRISQSIGIDDY